MNVVDFPGWLEYFADGSNATFFAPAIENTKQLIVPTVSIYEVFKRILQQRDEHTALLAISSMYQGKAVDLDTAVAIQAAKLSCTHKLPLSDSMILATAVAHQAILWTQDADFIKIEGVEYTERKKEWHN